jgi:hypothetical protein
MKRPMSESVTTDLKTNGKGIMYALVKFEDDSYAVWRYGAATANSWRCVDYDMTEEAGRALFERRTK